MTATPRRVSDRASGLIARVLQASDESEVEALLALHRYISALESNQRRKSQSVAEPTPQTEIDRLIAMAEYADSDAQSALRAGDIEEAKKAEAKRDRILNVALALDPERQFGSWTETALRIIP